MLDEILTDQPSAGKLSFLLLFVLWRDDISGICLKHPLWGLLKTLATLTLMSATIRATLNLFPLLTIHRFRLSIISYYGKFALAQLILFQMML